MEQSGGIKKLWFKVFKLLRGMRFRMAQTAKGPLESHSHIPPRNATLYGESPSYSATSGDPKPKTYCRCEQDRPIMSDGCVSTAVRRPHFFF